MPSPPMHLPVMGEPVQDSSWFSHEHSYASCIHERTSPEPNEAVDNMEDLSRYYPQASVDNICKAPMTTHDPMLTFTNFK